MGGEEAPLERGGGGGMPMYWGRLPWRGRGRRHAHVLGEAPLEREGEEACPCIGGGSPGEGGGGGMPMYWGRLPWRGRGRRHAHVLGEAPLEREGEEACPCIGGGSSGEGRGRRHAPHLLRTSISCVKELR